MDNDANGLAEPDEDVLTFDVPDEALERLAAVSDGKIVTIGYRIAAIGAVVLYFATGSLLYLLHNRSWRTDLIAHVVPQHQP